MPLATTLSELLAYSPIHGGVPSIEHVQYLGREQQRSRIQCPRHQSVANQYTLELEIYPILDQTLAAGWRQRMFELETGADRKDRSNTHRFCVVAVISLPLCWIRSFVPHWTSSSRRQYHNCILVSYRPQGSVHCNGGAGHCLRTDVFAMMVILLFCSFVWDMSM